MVNMVAEEDIKKLIVEALVLEDVTPDEIETEEPLFVEGLGLDSIDALELGMAISKKYNVKISQVLEENREFFASVKTLTAYVNKLLGEQNK